MTTVLTLTINRQPLDGDNLYFDFLNDSNSVYGGTAGNIITFKTTASTISQSTIGTTITNTITNLITKLNASYDTTTDSSTITYTALGTNQLVVTFSTNTAIISGYSSIIYNDSTGNALTSVSIYSYLNTTVNTTGFIKVNSPYFITYSDSKQYDKVELELRMWSGGLLSRPLNPNYKLSKYKSKSSDTQVDFNISNLIKSFINPQLDYNWGSTATNLDNVFDESIWVEYQMIGLLDVLDIDGNPTGGVLLVDTNSNRKIATLGYGYFEEGSNPTVNITDMTPQTNFISLVDPEYLTVGATGATLIEKTILRTKYSSRGVCEGLNQTYQVVYLNKEGVFEGFSFPKASKKTITSKTDKYNRLLNNPKNYSTIQHTSKVLNKTENMSYRLNTSLLKEIDVQKIQELIQSEKHYLYTNGIIIPVVLKDSTFEIKNSLYNRARIQYTLEFDAANEIKNNIV